MATPSFTGGVNIAMKIPQADYAATVAFYRDTLGWTLEEVDDTGAPTVTRSYVVDFGPCRLWLDEVPTTARSDVWLEVRTDDLGAAAERLAGAGVPIVDEVEPVDGLGSTAHWIRNPAGVVHLLGGDVTSAG